MQSRLESLDESEGCDRDGFEEAFYALSAKIRELISPSPTLRISIFSPSPSSVRDSDRSTHIWLPKLNLPTFSGKYEEWFFDTFNSVIHSNLALKYAKISVSMSVTPDDANGVISSLELSDANYDVAWSNLRDRYEQALDCSNSHQGYNGFAGYSKGKFNRSLTAPQNLYAFQALKHPTTHWDDLLILILTSKLDSLTLRE